MNKRFLFYLVIAFLIVGCDNPYNRERTNRFDPKSDSYEGSTEPGQDQIQLTGVAEYLDSYAGFPSAYQSFIPSKNKLTRVKLYLQGKYSGYSTPCWVYISTFIPAMYYDGNMNVVRNYLTASSIVSIGFGANWYEFDFPDITIEIGKTYYIGLVIQGSSAYENCLYWYRSSGDSYTQGFAFDKYRVSQNYDYTFITYYQ